jgi:hypothetical protein
MNNLYEVLVPTKHFDGRPIKTRFHRVWDKNVRNISSGLTILNPVKGQWVKNDNDVMAERMIPVRISCTKEQLDQILELTKKYYSQQVVMGL